LAYSIKAEDYKTKSLFVSSKEKNYFIALNRNCFSVPKIPYDRCFPKRLGRGPPLPPLAGASSGREEVGTRATKRENSFTLAAPAGDEPRRPTARTRSWLAHCSGQKGGGGGAQRSRAALYHEAPSEQRPTASKRRPVRPPRSRGTRAQRGGSHSADRHADSE
jgi:hypothetical protein